MKMKNVLLLALVATAMIGCGPKTQQVEHHERKELVETTVLRETEITRRLEFSTTLQGYLTMNVAPSLTGKIEHIFVEVGSTVEEGKLLVRMDQSQYNTTKLTYANLGVEMQRLSALREMGAVSQQAFDQTKLSYDQTKENLDFLERNTFFKAPFKGVISAKNYEDGELYSGQPILVLTQIHKLKALINIPETYFPYVKEGMRVNIMSDIYADNVFPATIEIIYPTVDASTHTFQAKLAIPNGSAKLRPGMYVHTTMDMGLAKALLVPYSSVIKMPGSNDRYLFVDVDGRAKRIFVKTGQRVDEKIEVISDELNAGDKVVTLGQGKLVDGTALNVTREN